MKKTFLRLYLLICVTVVVGCNENKSNDQNVINFSEAKQIDFGEFISSRSYIVLDNQPEAFISALSKIIKTDNGIYILDKNYIADKIVKFDLNGKYQCSIGRIGRGQKECLSIGDFDVYGDTIFILDYRNREIFKFTSDTVFDSRMKLGDYNAMNFEKTQNGYVLYAPNMGDEGSKFPIEIADQSARSYQKYGFYGDMPITLDILQAFSSNSNSIVHHRALWDSIIVFEKSNSAIKETYRLLFGGYAIDPYTVKLEELNGPKYSWLVSVPVVTNKLIFGYASIEGKSRPYIFSKTDEQVYFDGSQSIQTTPEFACMYDDNTIVSFMDEGVYEKLQQESPEFEVPRHIVDSLNAGHCVLTLYGLKSQNTDDR